MSDAVDSVLSGIDSENQKNFNRRSVSIELFTIQEDFFVVQDNKYVWM